MENEISPCKADRIATDEDIAKMRSFAERSSGVFDTGFGEGILAILNRLEAAERKMAETREAGRREGMGASPAYFPNPVRKRSELFDD